MEDELELEVTVYKRMYKRFTKGYEGRVIGWEMVLLTGDERCLLESITKWKIHGLDTYREATVYLNKSLKER